MLQSICKFIYEKVLGWKAIVDIPDFDKCIICVAPHTSNLDLFIGKLFIASVGRRAGFVMKKEWFVGPLDYIFRNWMGGIPVDRGKGTGLITDLVQIANESPTFHMALTPEGTRKANPKWHLGFYVIASQAGIPIVLLGIDYAKKEIRMERYVMPSKNRKEDLRIIERYFKDFKGRHPENFAIDPAFLEEGEK